MPNCKSLSILIWALAAALFSLGMPGLALGSEPGAPVAGASSVSVNRFYVPNQPESATTRRLIELMREDPAINIVQWGGISLPGGAGKASLMMAIAGRTAPDVGESWFHIIRSEIEQGFLYPFARIAHLDRGLQQSPFQHGHQHGLGARQPADRVHLFPNPVPR